MLSKEYLWWVANEITCVYSRVAILTYGKNTSNLIISAVEVSGMGQQLRTAAQEGRT